MNQGVAGVDPERDGGCVILGGRSTLSDPTHPTRQHSHYDYPATNSPAKCDLLKTDQKSRLTFASLTSFANRSVSAAINCFI